MERGASGGLQKTTEALGEVREHLGGLREQGHQMRRLGDDGQAESAS